jgi:hypothetical protein
VEHLLGGDRQDDAPPALDRLELLLGQARPHLCPEAEGGVEVLAHGQLLDLGRLAEEVRQLLAVLDDDGRRRHAADPNADRRAHR